MRPQSAPHALHSPHAAPSLRASSRWPRFPRPLFATVPFLFLPFAVGGCVGVSVGDIVNAVGSVAGTGKDVFSLGKLNTAQMASLNETVEAARQAAQDLRMSCKSESRDDDQTTELEFADDKCDTVTVRIEPRTPNLVGLRISVGIFGSEPIGRLFLTRLRAYLPKASSPVSKAEES